MSKKHRYYSYIFVDQGGDVEPIYQAVQAAHVAMVIGQRMNKKFDAKEIYFQVCKMPELYNLAGKLDEFVGYLTMNDFRVEHFYEPDIGKTIAVGTHPVRSNKRGILKNYDLLTFDPPPIRKKK